MTEYRKSYQYDFILSARGCQWIQTLSPRQGFFRILPREKNPLIRPTFTQVATYRCELRPAVYKEILLKKPSLTWGWPCFVLLFLWGPVPTSYYVYSQLMANEWDDAFFWPRHRSRCCNLRLNPKKKHGVWDLMPELSITSPYVHARVDSNTFTTGNPMLL